jgi:hypothetical protein
LEEKERLLHNLILENSQTADMCDAKLHAEIYKGVSNMQVLQSKQENKVKVHHHHHLFSFHRSVQNYKIQMVMEIVTS